MGEVFRARDAALGRDVAIKILPVAFAGDADRLVRFEREAQALASLNHPNIAQVYAVEAVSTGSVGPQGRASSWNWSKARISPIGLRVAPCRLTRPCHWPARSHSALKRRTTRASFIAT